MTTNRELDEILAEIGREHRSVGAPERLESVLRDAGDRNKASAAARSGLTGTWAAVAIVIVAVASAGVIWQIRTTPQAKNQPVQSLPGSQVGAETAPPSTAVAKKQSVTAKSTRTDNSGTDRVSRRAAPQKQPGWSSLDEFVPLPVSEGLPPAADLSLVRIRLRGSDLQQYGLEAPADAAAQTMLAEFVVGEDGLPRAIRIVR